MADRHTLHHTRLDAFRDWAVAEGFTNEKTKGDFEVLRLRHPKLKHPLLVYDRHEGDHFTVFGTGESVVKRFIRATKVSA